MLKTYKITFLMKVENSCTITPKQMLEQDDEDGEELGFSISNINIKEK